MPVNTQTIYSNGRYRLVPVVTLLRVEVEGRRLQDFDLDEVDLAVRTVDEMAECDGERGHVTQ